MPKATSQEEVLEAIKTTHIEVEMDRSWCWVVSPETAPVHQIKGGCKCEACQERAAIRERLKEIGFRFAFQPHILKSGATSRWGHNCGHATRYRKNKGGSDKAPRETEKPDDDLAEAMQFFKD
jgi:hypothetical protein